MRRQGMVGRKMSPNVKKSLSEFASFLSKKALEEDDEMEVEEAEKATEVEVDEAVVAEAKQAPAGEDEAPVAPHGEFRILNRLNI